MIVLACGLSLGRHLNSRDSRELGQVDALIDLLKFVKIQIECFALSAPQILSRCDAESLRLCGYELDEVPKSFEELVLAVRIKNGEACKIFCDFTKGFGKSYREEQLRQCEHYIGLLEGVQEKLAGELQNKRKLNLTLCIAGALAVIILLI